MEHTALRKKRNGQAAIMVTLALIAMFGLIGLAVDLGWAYFVRKSARAAADAAALAAVKAAYAALSASPVYSCTTNMTCGTVQCPNSLSGASNNLEHGCLYAKQNGFAYGGLSGRQEVSLTGGITSPFETGTGPVAVHYWASATVTQRIPQLFSAILGNTLATVSVTSTAAILERQVPGSLILLNRQYDRTDMQAAGGSSQHGVNLLVQANANSGGSEPYSLRTAGGIRMASECRGDPLAPCTSAAGWLGGSSIVRSPDIRIRGRGTYESIGGAQWLPQNPKTGEPDGPSFRDPMAGRGQPSWKPVGDVPDVRVYPRKQNGVIDPAGKVSLRLECQARWSGACRPGKYYTVDAQGTATGNPLIIDGTVTFSPGSDPIGTYVFYGGVVASGNGATANFDPGVYTFAGARPLNSNTPGVLLDQSTNFAMYGPTTSLGPNDASDAGTLFIFTDGNYFGSNSGPITPPSAANGWAPAFQNEFKFGTVNFQSGNNGTEINLHGLNPEHPAIEGNAELKPFAPVLVWWDRNNSSVRHNTDGTIDASCGSVDNPCTNNLTYPNSVELTLYAGPDLHLYGVIAQPRGTWTTMIGGGDSAGPIQLITGALEVRGNSKVDLGIPKYTATVTVVALIQ